MGTSLSQSGAGPFPLLCTPQAPQPGGKPSERRAPGCGDLPSSLVKLLAGCWGDVRGVQLLFLGFPQVVIAEVALEALELGIVVVGCGVAVRAAGLWQVVSADIPICRKTDRNAQRAHEQASLPSPLPAESTGEGQRNRSPHATRSGQSSGSVP